MNSNFSKKNIKNVATTTDANRSVPKGQEALS